VHPHRPSSGTPSACVLLRIALISASLLLAAQTSFADPAPPFVAQFFAATASPSGLATDVAGNVYLVDTGNNRVLKFSNVGTLLTSWGSAGTGNGQFNQPWGVAVSATNVYVTDGGNARVQKFTPAGVFVSAWSSPGARGITLDPVGNLYVTGASSIVKSTNTGGPILSWGSAGSGNGQFNTPLGVAVDAAGFVYVADTNNGRVQRFSGSGTFLAQWPVLGTPNGICVDNGGHVIVAETGAYRVDAFTSAGILISQWGSQGGGGGQFQLPRAVTTNSSGNVFVLDTGNQLLQVFGTVTSTILASNANPAVFGQLITLSATVAPTTIAGVVYLKDAGAVIASSGTVAGVALFGVSNLSVGSHSLTGFYSGDPSSAASTSDIVSQQVNKAATITSVLSLLNPSGSGQRFYVKMTASVVAPGAGTPTGSVTLLVDGTPVLTTALSGGTVTTWFNGLAAGSHSLAASYGGDANFAASMSTSSTQVVVPMQAPPIWLTEWPINGAGPPYSSATQLATDAFGHVFVPDYINDRIQKYSNTGGFISQFGAFGSGAGQFISPSSIATDNLGSLYIADSGNHRIALTDLSGVSQGSWGTSGTGDGQFTSPRGVAVDASRNVYVSDAGANRIEKFTSDGTFITKWGSSGSGDGQFNAPNSIATDRAGNVYVADTQNHRIQKFTSSGVYVTQWGQQGSENGQFFYPLSVIMDAADNLLVADEVNHRIQKFSSSGTFLTKWGTMGTAPNQFTSPQALGADPIGNIYVMDHSTLRVQKFFFVQSIATITDVPGDQGHQVRIRFLQNGSDIASSPAPVTSYEIYRQSNASALAQQSVRIARPLARPSSAYVDGWDYLLTIPAHTDAVYEAVVSTLADSNASSTHRSVFFVRAATGAPSVFWDSVPDSGFSVDNLPPVTPAPFTAAYASGATALHWGRNSEPDLWYYRIYRGGTVGFVPSPATLIATRADTGYADVGAAGRYYKLSAIDVDGNESGYASLTPDVTVSVGTVAPLRFSLAGARPNPARANRLTVEFELPMARSARLDLLDVGGRLVATRDVGVLGAGRHSIDFAAGRHLSPGLYLIRLQQGAMVSTLRAVVLE
jgi:sugar lactone lactonase YvrE